MDIWIVFSLFALINNGAVKILAVYFWDRFLEVALLSVCDAWGG